MEERTKDAWIFLHRNALEKLINSEGVSVKEGKKVGTMILTWEAAEKFPKTRIVVNVCSMATDWKTIILISASDIAFNLMPTDPEYIYFLKMEE